MDVDPDFKIDDRLIRYAEPKTAVSRLVQRPLYLIDGNALVNAFMSDVRASRRNALDKERG